MTDAFLAVVRGLRVAHTGYLLTCWGAASACILIWLISNTGYRRDTFALVLWIAFWGNIVIGVGGVIAGIVGRVMCLRMPTEYPAVRGRAIAAVVLEGSGWLSAFVGVGIGFAMGYKMLPQQPIVLLVGGILSALLLLCGRILYLRFLRVLARVVEDPATDRLAKHSLTLFIVDWAAGLVGTGIGSGCSALGMYELASPLAFAVFIPMGMSGLAGLVLYDRVLGHLTRSVRAFADLHRDDEEEAYRARQQGEPEDEPSEADDRREEPEGDD